MKNVILEGPDGSGKSTIATLLEREWGYAVERCGPPNEKLTRLELLDNYYKQHTAGGSPLVVDRSVLGEIIYGPICRGMAKISTTDVLDFFKWFREEQNGVVVLCLPPLAQCMSVWNSRRDREYVRRDRQYLQIYQSFTQWRHLVDVVNPDWGLSPEVMHVIRLSDERR